MNDFNSGLSQVASAQQGIGWEDDALLDEREPVGRNQVASAKPWKHPIVRNSLITAQIIREVVTSTGSAGGAPVPQAPDVTRAPQSSTSRQVVGQQSDRPVFALEQQYAKWARLEAERRVDQTRRGRSDPERSLEVDREDRAR